MPLPSPAGQDDARALGESEARLALATGAADIGIWDWDLTTGGMVYSPIAKAICGFQADLDVTFEQVRDLVHPDDYPLTSAQAARALDPAVRENAPFEYRITLPDGTIRWVLAYGRAMFAEREGGLPNHPC